jgi:hypothetical protein
MHFIDILGIIAWPNVIVTIETKLKGKKDRKGAGENRNRKQESHPQDSLKKHVKLPD